MTQPSTLPNAKLYLETHTPANVESDLIPRPTTHLLSFTYALRRVKWYWSKWGDMLYVTDSVYMRV